MIQEILKLIEKLDAPHLSYGIDTLDQNTLRAFYEQLLTLEKQLPLIKKALSSHKAPSHITPFTEVKNASIFSPKKSEAIREGRVAAVLLAGGQGTRLGVPYSKGLFELTESHKTLFELFFEKVKAASLYYGRDLFVAIMVSPLNQEAIYTYFKKKTFFGLKKETLFFFTQEMLPFLSDVGKPLLSKSGSILEGPSGNGMVFSLLKKQGIVSSLKEAGVSFLEIHPIDNPLIFPFDETLSYYHEKEGYDVIFKAFEKKDPSDPFGVIALCDKKIRVLEYSEIDPKLSQERTKEGKLHYFLANSGHLSVTLSFIDLQEESLPLHSAKKKAPFLDEKGNKQEGMLQKLETFIFDPLSDAKHPLVLLLEKESFFAPLKEKEGKFGIQKTKEALYSLNRSIFEHFYHKKAGNKELEIDPILFYKKEL